MVGYAFHYKNSKRPMVENFGEMRRIKPRWVELFLSNKFFGICELHRKTRKSEINIYCVDCNLRMCSHCVSEDLSHRCHHLIQIRRYVYQDVVRIRDMQKLIDCSKIQPYIVNKAKVLLLNARKQFRPSKSQLGGAACKMCRRSVVEPNRYCSIGCKVSDESADAPSAAHNKSGPLMVPMTPDLEDLAPADDDSAGSLSPPQQSDSAGDNNPGRLMVEEETEAATPKGRILKRKGIPRRSPFF